MEHSEVDHLNVDIVWWLYPSIEVGASLLYGSSARARCNKPFMYGVGGECNENIVRSFPNASDGGVDGGACLPRITIVKSMNSRAARSHPIPSLPQPLAHLPITLVSYHHRRLNTPAGYPIPRYL